MVKYVFLPGPAHGHVNPTLAVAQELVMRGEQAVYYLTEDFQTTVEATGATFQPYQSMMNQFTMGNRQPPSSRLWNSTLILGAMLLTIVKESQHVIPQVLEGLRGEQVHCTPTFGEHVRAMQQTVRAAGGYRRAVEVISHFASIQNR